MMLKIMKSIENVVEKYAKDYRFINDHELNVVCQIEADEENIECMLAEIDEKLPIGIVFSHVFADNECEITFKEVKTMSKYQIECNILDATIQNEFGPLDWADQTLDEDEDLYSITFTGPTYTECCDEDGNLDGIKLLALQDGFFAKMHGIKRMLHNCGYNDVTLKKYEANKCDPFSEATININLADKN